MRYQIPCWRSWRQKRGQRDVGCGLPAPSRHGSTGKHGEGNHSMLLESETESGASPRAPPLFGAVESDSVSPNASSLPYPIIATDEAISVTDLIVRITARLPHIPK